MNSYSQCQTSLANEHIGDQILLVLTVKSTTAEPLSALALFNTSIQ